MDPQTLFSAEDKQDVTFGQVFKKVPAFSYSDLTIELQDTSIQTLLKPRFVYVDKDR